MRASFRLFVLALIVHLFALPSRLAFATTIAEVNTGTSTNAGAEFAGQSFTVVGAGSYDDITFNFFTFGQSPAPYAIGTGYLFSQAYTGTPAGLSSSDAGFLGSAAASGGMYDFNSSVVLQAGQQYFFYEDTLIPADTISGNVVYSGGSFYFTSSSSSDYNATTSANFLVTGQAFAATPEPSAFALLSTGILGLASVSRRRLRQPI
jgi:hypothetical protein